MIAHGIPVLLNSLIAAAAARNANDDQRDELRLLEACDPTPKVRGFPS